MDRSLSLTGTPRATVNGGQYAGLHNDLDPKHASHTVESILNEASDAGNEPDYGDAIFRAFNLQSLLSWESDAEPVKFAIYKSRVIVAIHCLVHVVPLIGALGLIAANSRGNYVSSEFSSDTLVGLQFVAKFHEITMVASLTAVLVSYIRLQITSEQGVPFGAAFAGLQITQLAYLWSPELWGSMKSASFHWQIKVRFVVPVVVVSFLVATVGPSSAACLIPRYRTWSDGTYVVGVDMPIEELFPTNLTSELFGVAPSRQQSDDLWSAYTSPETSVKPSPWASDPQGLNSLLSLPQSMPLQLGWYNTSGAIPWTLTIPKLAPTKPRTRPPTLSFSYQLPLSDDINATTSVQSPGLLSYFQFAEYWQSATEVRDAVSYVALGSQPVWWDRMSQPPSLDFGLGQSDLAVQFSEDDNKRLRAGLERMTGPENTPYNDLFFVNLQDNSTGGIVMAFSDSSQASADITSGVWLTPFTFRLGWVSTQWHQQTYPIITSNITEPNGMSIQHEVRASQDWLDTVNPYVSSFNKTIFNLLIPDSLICSVRCYDDEIIERWDLLKAAYSISTLLTATLSKVTPSPSGCSNWGQFGRGAASTMDCMSTTDKVTASSSQFTLKVGRQGYGYGFDVLAVRLSLAVLMIYSSITMLHIIYCGWSGISSTAWSSVAEIAALCLNSRCTPELENTCAGIRRLQTYERRVRIVATASSATNSSDIDHSTADHLEFVFPSTERRALSCIQPNHEYGALREEGDTTTGKQS